MTATYTPTTPRGEQAKNQLIRAALAQFGEYGLHATTRDIAALAEQNIAAIAYYFGSKEDLYTACARWIADFIGEQLQPQLMSAIAILAEDPVDKSKIRALIHQVIGHMIALLTQDETLNLSKFISREQLSPTPAYRLIHQQVIEPMHAHMTALIGRYTGRDPDDVETIVHTHALLGEILTFRLLQETALLRTGWQQFDQHNSQLITRVVTQHFDFILQGLSQQRSTA